VARGVARLGEGPALRPGFARPVTVRARTLAGAAALACAACAGGRDGGVEGLPAWIGEGAVAYVSRAAGQYDVRVVSADGQRDEPVAAALDADELHPTLALASGRLCYWTFRDGGGRIVIRELGSGAERTLDTGDLVVANPALSPDGTRITFEGSRPPGMADVYVAEVDGAGPPVAVAADPALDAEPAWSADGAALLFGSERGGSYEVWRADAAGRGPAFRLTGAEGAALTCGSAPCAILGRASPSPDGRAMAFVRATPAGGFRVVVRELAAGTERVLADADETEPDWSPDGSSIAVTTGAYGEPEVVVRGSGDGALRQRLTRRAGIDGSPAYAR